jgi:hypothetical protein
MRHLPANFHTHEHGAVRPPVWWVLVPSRTVLPFLRTPLGYDMVHPRRVIGAAIMLIVWPLVFWFLYVGLTKRHPPENIGHVWLVGFAAASVLLSGVIFVRRAIGQGRGEQIHTAEAGYSVLTWRTGLPVPLIEQILIPLALAGAGWLIKDSFSLELGWWLVACGLSYFLMARWEHRRRWSQTRATVDDMIRAHTFEERLDEHERQTKGARPGSGQTSRPGARATGREGEPDMAELGGYDPPAAPPDMAAWRQDNDGVMPDTLSWFRRRGRGK